MSYVKVGPKRRTGSCLKLEKYFRGGGSKKDIVNLDVKSWNLR